MTFKIVSKESQQEYEVNASYTINRERSQWSLTTVNAPLLREATAWSHTFEDAVYDLHQKILDLEFASRDDI